MSTTDSRTKESTHRTINSLEEVREQTTSQIADALRGDLPVLIESPPASGKSHGLVEAIERTGESVAVFTQRGREEQYEQYQQWCDERALHCKILPSAYEDCPTLRGDHGEEQKQRITNLLDAGASPNHVHDRLEDLPCLAGGPCPYQQAIAFDPTDYDVLVGHPSHAYVEEYLENHVPVFDEFPGGEYITEIRNVPEVVGSFLQDHNIAFQNYIDLLQNHDNSEKRHKAVNQIKEIQLVDEEPLFDDDGRPRHRLAGLCVLTLIESTDLGNGWESAILGNDRMGVFDQDTGTVHILNPPNLPEQVVGLDGTPIKSMWDLALGFYDRRRRLNHQRVLNNKERQRYISNIQNLQIIPTTTNVRPYSGGNTTPQRDAALLHEAARLHPGKKGVISSKSGRGDLEETFNGIGEWKVANYPVRGSNELGDVDAGVIVGSPHYGDPFIQRWSALAGIAAESNGEQGISKSYGEFGDKVLRYMREHSVLQALFRFARSGDGATVYVDTVALPDWVPVVADPEDTSIDTWSPAELDIIESLNRLGEARTKELAEDSNRSSRSVTRFLGDISDDIVSERRAADGRGGAKKWVDKKLSSLNPYGQVDLAEPSSPTRFSDKSPYRNSMETCPEKTSSQLEVQREMQAEYQRRRDRQIRQMEMENWYGSG